MSSTTGGLRLDVCVRRVALALLLTFAGACSQAGPAWSPDGSTIVFAFERGEHSALAACDLERGEVRALFDGGDDYYHRLLFDESGERVVVLAVEEGLAGVCEILTLSLTGEELSRHRLEAPVHKATTPAQALVLPMFVEGRSLWFAWQAVDEPTRLAYRRFDLDRNELTGDSLPQERIVVRRGDELIGFDTTQLEGGRRIGVSTRPLASAEWSPPIELDSLEKGEELRALALGQEHLALVLRLEGERKEKDTASFDVLLIDLEYGSCRRISIPDLGECGTAVLGPDDRELCMLAAKDGVLWLHRVATQDGAIRSLRLFQANPLRTPPDELLARDATLALSPDGARLAVSVFSYAHEVGQPDLFVFELGDELGTVGRFHAPR